MVIWTISSIGCNRDARTIAAAQLSKEGGVRLIYEIDTARMRPGQQVNVQRLTDVVAHRLATELHENRFVTAGPGQAVTVLITGDDPAEVATVKKLLAAQGVLEFRIVADPNIDDSLIKIANRTSGAARPQDEDASRANEIHLDLIKMAEEDKTSALIIGGNERARWTPIAAEDQAAAVKDPNLVTRRAADGVLQKLVIIGQERFRWVTNPMLATGPGAGHLAIAPDNQCVSRTGPGGVNELLVLISPIYVHGNQLTSARVGSDANGNKVNFSLNAEGARQMLALTSRNLPVQGRARRIAILLDDTVLSAPTVQSAISDSGQITGNFTHDEVKWLVMILNSGALPSPLRKQPVREEHLPPGSTL
ncbi:MAG: hypothetical protein K8T25_18470 [Planctomycetia bacterium]|nr:hypothetical protein [Planctomycetia bacterium]